METGTPIDPQASTSRPVEKGASPRATRLTPRRRWSITGAVIGAVLLLIGVGVGVWQWSEQAAADRAYHEALADVRDARNALQRTAQSLDEARLTAAALLTRSAEMSEVADPQLLESPEPLDALAAAAEALSTTADLTVDDNGSLTAPAAASVASANSTNTDDRPGDRAALQSATVTLRAEANSLRDETAELAAQLADVEAAVSTVREATAAVLASAHTHGTALEVPELAPQEHKDRFAAALEALAVASAAAADDGADGDPVTVLTEYRDAYAAMVAAHEEAVRAQDPASIEPTYIQGVLVVNKTYPLPSWYGNGLTAETLAAFDQMQAAAAEAGHTLTITSGFRSYDTQYSLYHGLVSRVGQAAADRDTARPGHSEHQSGLTFDLNCICEDFGHQADGQWVAANAHRFGFIVRYPQGKEHITGYIWEPWHLRYLGVETATAVYESGLSLEEYLGITSQYAD